jgi:hypothetical protein
MKVAEHRRRVRDVARVAGSSSGCRPKEMPRVLKQGLVSKKLKAKGRKRATMYFAA